MKIIKKLYLKKNKLIIEDIQKKIVYIGSTKLFSNKYYF